EESRRQFGSNTLEYEQQHPFIGMLKSIAKEPMIVLLLVASAIYFLSGKYGDGFFMASAIVLVAGISLFQDSRSRLALQKLKDFSQPSCTVIRNGKTLPIRSEELVVGDLLMEKEGAILTADGSILHSNDFSVNESILTGESLPVYKDISREDHQVYSGTMVTSGLAIIRITAVGIETRLGKIGTSLAGISDEKTPLEIQINQFVRHMVYAGILVFIMVWGINYLRSAMILDSLLKALTLAMSILPEEIPVAFTTFMALGAWRLMKLGIVVKQMKTVETLGSATIICTDKTGTLTENRMSLARLYVPGSSALGDPAQNLNSREEELICTAMWASEPIPFDPMEVTLHDAYVHLHVPDERKAYQMIHEYPLGGNPPMMTHIFENNKKVRIIAAKGAPEVIMQVCGLKAQARKETEYAIQQMANEGYRILGVAKGIGHSGPFPAQQQDLMFQFKGLVAFYDPPKENMRAVLNAFYQAGIVVKIVTGDNAATTLAIARQIGFRNAENNLSGEELMHMSNTQLRQKVNTAGIFTRMFPESKLRIIQALKANREVVAMTGDGVNDGPSLKAANIGIAMGRKGSGLAREAASLILLEDDLSKMIDAIAMGRRIYANLKKAIRYIISIHIPIILTVFIPLVLGWIYPHIFSPIHIIFLEIIMGPTCSILYENEPMEKNTMVQKPRSFSTTFFSPAEIRTSIVQGLVITAGTLSTYRYAVYLGYDEALTRTLVFTVLISANIFLTLINRSFYYSILNTLAYKNRLVPLIIGITFGISVLLIYIPPFASFFGFEVLHPLQVMAGTGIGFLSVIWYEGVKWGKRRKRT
ncbi:MAG TPA: cation-translocating P-type ATPase, partial [Bacteroidia bacterium]|nr:cation-translocating P-type ATPase [Bacteroidia bacterium]